MISLQDHHGLLFVAIVLARVLDVSLGTVRTILVFRGRRLLVAMIGFFEILIWVGAAGVVLQNLTAWYLAVAYAGGFALGNVVGMWLESKLGIGYELVRAISGDPTVPLAELLRRQAYGVVEVSARAAHGQPVEVLLVVERRRRVRSLLECIEAADPTAVCTVTDVKHHRAVPELPARAGWARWFGLGKQK